MTIRMKRCPVCLRNSPRDAEVCPGCRTEFAFRERPRTSAPVELPSGARWVAPAPHDVSVAALAAIFLVGTGQLYNHQTAKGVLVLAVTVLILLFARIFWSDLLLALAAVVYVVAILDATTIAGRLLDQEQVRPWQWF